MRLLKLGKNISKVEIQGISSQGVWLWVKEKEYFLPFKDFPWFEDAKISDISNVRFLHGHHLHWPLLDVDIELESLEYPENYPLKYK